MKRLHITAIIIGTTILACWLFSQPVHASDHTFWLQPQQTALNAEIAFTHRSEEDSSLTVISPLLSGQYAMLKEVALSLDWGFCGIVSHPDKGSGDTVFRFGNPWLQGIYNIVYGETRGHFGIGLTLPLASVDTDPNGRLMRAAYNYAMGMRGLWNIWLWGIRRLTVTVPAGIETIIDSRWVLGAEAAAALLVPTKKSEGDPDIFTQLAAEAGYEIEMFRISLRMQAVLMPTIELDKTQFSLQPWLRYRFESASLATWGTINLDEPLGGGKGMELWSIHVGGGIVF